MMSDRPSGRRRPAIRPRTILVHVVAWGIGLAWLIPFLGVFMTAVRPQAELLRGWWNLDPFTPTLQNFALAWGNADDPMWRGLRNSAIVAIPSTLVPMFVASFAAYGFARYRFPFRDYIFLSIILLMAIPQQMVAVPLFLALLEANLLDNFVGIVLVHSAWGIPWILLFMKNFFQTLPVEVEEAARVDGASDFRIFFKIVMPMALPALAAVAVLQFMWVWNDFFFALIFLRSQENLVATQVMFRVGFLGPFIVDQGILSAAAVITLAVPVLVYTFLQRYYIRGMIGWTIKG